VGGGAARCSCPHPTTLSARPGCDVSHAAHWGGRGGLPTAGASPTAAPKKTTLRRRIRRPFPPPSTSSGLPISAARDGAPASSEWHPRSLGSARWRVAGASSDDAASASASDGDAAAGFLPPHILVERQHGSSAVAGRGARPLRVGSVCVGVGRKLTGSAAARFRVEVMRQTGFLEGAAAAAKGGEGGGDAKPVVDG
jgi:hypothetical protein